MPLPVECFDDSGAILEKDMLVYAKCVCKKASMAFEPNLISKTPKWFNCSYEKLWEIMRFNLNPKPMMLDQDRYVPRDCLHRFFKYHEFNQSTGNVFDNLDPIESHALKFLLTRHIQVAQGIRFSPCCS